VEEGQAACPGQGPVVAGLTRWAVRECRAEYQGQEPVAVVGPIHLWLGVLQLYTRSAGMGLKGDKWAHRVPVHLGPLTELGDD
jgi:hypothetical protein